MRGKKWTSEMTFRESILHGKLLVNSLLPGGMQIKTNHFTSVSSKHLGLTEMWSWRNSQNM